MRNSTQIEETAATWIARRAGDDWSDADQAGLAQWLEEATAHRVAFIRLDAAWGQAPRLKALRAGTAVGAPPEPGQWGRAGHLFKSADVESSLDSFRSRGRGIGSRQWAALAASVLLAISIAVGWFVFSPRGDTYSTVVGGLQTVPLSDGSQVTLNTQTGIRIAMTETERRVDLEQGEAFFEVAKDPNRPFVVKAGDRRVIAVGTKFSVLRDGETFRVVVTEGQVRVERDGGGTETPLKQLAAGIIVHGKRTEMPVPEQPIADAEGN